MPAAQRNGSDVGTGKPYEIETLDVGDLRAGIIKTSWLPLLTHPSLGEAERVEFSKQVVRGVTLNVADGAATVSGEWNQIFPDYKFTTVEEFLTEVFGNA